MRKFGDYIEESLAAEVKSEPKSTAAKEARQLGLTYMGFGRYADNRGRISYIVDNGRLVPYKSREEMQDMFAKSAFPSAQQKNIVNDYYSHADIQDRRNTEDVKILKQKTKEINKLSKELFQFYKPNMFSQDEIYALRKYTGESYGPINGYLYKGFEPNTTQDDANETQSLINAIDSAFEETQAPFPYTVYSGLSSRYSANKIKSGGEYIFRGYLSTSIDFNTAISGFTDIEWENNANNTVVLQIEVSKGQKSIYLDSLSDNPGEKETLLPRGSRIKVISGPHLMDYGILNPDAGQRSISLFHCELMEDI